MKPPPNPLSEQLRQLRRDAKMSGAEAARASGLSPAKISRVETGTYMPTPNDIDTLCRVYRAPADTRRRLVAAIGEIREETQSARVTLQRGGWQMQQRIGRIEAAATRIRSFSPDTVIGIAQTESYIRAILRDFLSGDDLERTVRARLERQELLTSGRRFDLVMSEGAVRWNTGGAATMVGQLERLIDLSRLADVRLGIIPWTTETGMPGAHAFHQYDAGAVIVGTLNATAIITDEQDIAEYQSWFDRLEALASHGDDARAELRRIAHDYRSIG